MQVDVSPLMQDLDSMLTAAYADGRADERTEWLPVLDALRTARQELRFKNLTEDGGQRTNTAIARALIEVDAAIAKVTGAA